VLVQYYSLKNSNNLLSFNITLAILIKNSFKMITFEEMVSRLWDEQNIEPGTQLKGEYIVPQVLRYLAHTDNFIVVGYGPDNDLHMSIAIYPHPEHAYSFVKPQNFGWIEPGGEANKFKAGVVAMVVQKQHSNYEGWFIPTWQCLYKHRHLPEELVKTYKFARHELLQFVLNQALEESVYKITYLKKREAKGGLYTSIFRKVCEDNEFTVEETKKGPNIEMVATFNEN